jgi:hypothetical protein
MPSPFHSPMLEEMIRNISHVPEPKEAFIVSLRERFVSAGQANAKPSAAKRMIKPIRTLRTRRLVWGLIIAILIAAAILLATSPTVVTALKRLLGYIPGVGIVEQGSSLRTLEKPVSVERDGIRMTVEEAVADSTRTVVSFKVEWLNPPSTEGEMDESCVEDDSPKLTLANGSLLSQGRTSGKNIWHSGYSYIMEFSPLPADQNDAILVYKCIVPLFPGPLPQNWQIPLHFIPGDHLNLAPVVEVPTASPIPTIPSQPAATSQPAQNFGISFVLDKVVELETGYLFLGHVTWSDPNVSPYGVTLPSNYPMKLTDSSGQVIPLEEGRPDEALSNEKQTLWAYQSAGKGTGPLTLTVDTMMVDLATKKATFQFDPGPNPRPNQAWPLNLDVDAGGHTIHILSASLDDQDPQVPMLTFTMQSDQAVGTIRLEDLDHPQGGGGGGGDELEPGPITSNVYYQGGLPARPLNISVTDIILQVNGPWQVTWSPK